MTLFTPFLFIITLFRFVSRVGGTRGDNSEQRDIRPAVARPLLRPLCDNIPRRDDIEQQHTANFRDHVSFLTHTMQCSEVQV